jgi:uncharacterized lipoprotein YehR (DUF1307 family)
MKQHKENKKMSKNRMILVLLAMGLTFFQLACSNKKDIPEAVLWINGTHAVLTKINKGNVNQFGTMASNVISKAMVQKSLADSWGVTTKQELDEMVDSLVIGLHNPRFLDEAEEYGITDMTKNEFEAELSAVSNREAVMYTEINFVDAGARMKS